MNKINLSLSILILVVTVFLFEKSAFGQSSVTSGGDSLILEQVIQAVVQSHPTVKDAEEALNAADAKIAMAKSSFLPNIDASGSYSRVGPVPSIPFPINGVVENFKLFPADNFNASLNFHETVYDFGKTKKSVQYEGENRKLAEQDIQLVKQRLSQVVANTFFALVYLQDARNIKKEQLNTLKEHLEFVQKKKETGSATQYEILTIQVKISGVESQLIDLETSSTVMYSLLNTMMGQPDGDIHPVKKSFNVQLPMLRLDSMISYADANRYEMKMARQMEAISQFRYDVVKTQDLPIVNIFASGGNKNGYVPDLNTFKWNFAAGFGINVPIFDGNRKHNNLLLATSSIKSANYQTEATHRNITNEVVQSQASLNSSQKKLDQALLQLTQAEQAFDLAKVSYQSGAITNLDLLDATTSLSETRLLLLKARIDHALSIYTLKLALGDRIY
jgi:outer membrane protein